MKSFPNTSFAALLALAGAAFVTPAQAQFSDPLGDVLETMGIKSKQKDEIVYRERAPLVVPPKAERLRAPEQGAAEKNARWPQDPDVLAAKRRKAEAALPQFPESEKSPSQGGLLRHEPLGKRNRYAGVPIQGVHDSGSDAGNPARMVSREQVQALAAEYKDTDKPTGAEPERQYLTEPPNGYRRPAAGAPVRATLEPMRPSGDSLQINALRPQN